MNRLRAVLDTRFAGKLTFRLQQTQLAGACYGFGASLDLQFAGKLTLMLQQTQLAGTRYGFGAPLDL